MLTSSQASPGAQHLPDELAWQSVSMGRLGNQNMPLTHGLSSTNVFAPMAPMPRFLKPTEEARCQARRTNGRWNKMNAQQIVKLPKMAYLQIKVFMPLKHLCSLPLFGTLTLLNKISLDPRKSQVGVQCLCGLQEALL